MQVHAFMFHSLIHHNCFPSSFFLLMNTILNIQNVCMFDAPINICLTAIEANIGTGNVASVCMCTSQRNFFIHNNNVNIFIALDNINFFFKYCLFATKNIMFLYGLQFIAILPGIRIFIGSGFNQLSGDVTTTSTYFLLCSAYIVFKNVLIRMKYVNK